MSCRNTTIHLRPRRFVGTGVSLVYGILTFLLNLVTSGCQETEKLPKRVSWAPSDLKAHISELHGFCEYGERVPTLLMDEEWYVCNEILGIPEECKAVWLRGHYDFSNLPLCPELKYATIDEQNCHWHPRKLVSLLEKMPGLEYFDFSDGANTDVDRNESLDLGVFADMAKLQSLALQYCGRIAGSDKLIDSKPLKKVWLSVGYQLGERKPYMYEAKCVNPDCYCKEVAVLCASNVECRIEREDSFIFKDGVLTLFLKNLGETPVEIPEIPECCHGLHLDGKFKFSGIRSYSHIVDLTYFNHNASRADIADLDFSHFPNLKSLDFRVTTHEACELDYRKIECSGSLEVVIIDCWGDCVVRGIDRAFTNDRIWWFSCLFEKGGRNWQKSADSATSDE